MVILSRKCCCISDLSEGEVCGSMVAVGNEFGNAKDPLPECCTGNSDLSEGEVCEGPYCGGERNSNAKSPLPECCSSIPTSPKERCVWKNKDVKV